MHPAVAGYYVCMLLSVLKTFGYIVAIVITAVIALVVACAGITYAYKGGVCTDMHAGAFLTEPKAPPSLMQQIPNIQRRGATTFLTFPEWYIVWSSQEYAQHLSAGKTPSSFPYLKAIAQYWCSYQEMAKVADTRRGRDTGEHIALITIGLSFSAEYLAYFAYENTLGAMTERLWGTATAEDALQARVAHDYGQFLYQTPFYDYPYAEEFSKLWRNVPKTPSPRGWERRGFLSILYSVKAGYGWAIGGITHASYGAQPTTTPTLLSVGTPVTIEPIIRMPEGSLVVFAPNYHRYTSFVRTLPKGSIIEIAGYPDVVVSALVPENYADTNVLAYRIFSQPILTESGRMRIILDVPVGMLGDVFEAIESQSGTVEHVYDYI